MKRRAALVVAGLALVSAACPGARARSRTLRVGPGADVASIADAARVAQSGDTVEIQAGTYEGDVATWRQDGITIRGVGGRARLVADGASAEDKAIFVVHGDDVLVEGLEFAGARVPDENGAGIRHEGGRLTVRDCLFERNEMGILTWNDARAELVVEHSEFRDNATAPEAVQRSPGHQIYVGTIARFTLRDSYVHRGAGGHLVKSRARHSVLANNRIVDEREGHASYEIEFPNGGLAFVLGNVVAQSAGTENPVLIAFGAEGYRWPQNELYVSHNTLVDDYPGGGQLLRIHPGAGRVRVVNNLLVGNARIDRRVAAEYAGNARAAAGDLADPARGDYRVKARSRLAGAAHDPGRAHDVALLPQVDGGAPARAGTLRLTPGASQRLAP